MRIVIYVALALVVAVLAIFSQSIIDRLITWTFRSRKLETGSTRAGDEQDPSDDLGAWLMTKVQVSIRDQLVPINEQLARQHAYIVSLSRELGDVKRRESGSLYHHTGPGARMPNSSAEDASTIDLESSVAHFTLPKKHMHNPEISGRNRIAKAVHEFSRKHGRKSTISHVPNTDSAFDKEFAGIDSDLDRNLESSADE